MANKKKEKPPKAEAEKTQIATTEEPTEESDALAVEALLELAPKTFLGRVRYNVLGILGFLSQEELEAEELAQRLREEKEAEDAAYEALPWIQKCERYPLKVSLLSIADVKSALDDAVRSMLIDEAQFVEDNTHSNRKLVIGYVAVVIALVASAYSFYVPFQDSKWILGKAVSSYFLLVLAMWLYGLFVEKDCIFVGVQSNPLYPHIQQLHVSSTFERKKGIYTVLFAFSKIPPPPGGPKEVIRKCEKCVGDWFDVDGRFAASVFRKDVEEVLQGNVMHLQ